MTIDLAAHARTSRRVKALVPMRFKAVGEADELGGGKLEDGQFIATAAVFDVIDSYGEVMRKGAFADTLQKWADSGDPIPVIWQHMWSDPMAHIGEVLDIKETDEALLYKGAVDLDNPFAAQVYRLMKARRVKQQSFGFDILEAGFATVEGQDVYEIRAVDLFEVGPCLVGVNQATNLLDIKSQEADEGDLPSPEPSGQAQPAAGSSAADSGEPPVDPPAPGEPPAAEPPASKGPRSPASTRAQIAQFEYEREVG